MSRPFSSRNRGRNFGGPFIRTNQRIRAREVRVIGPDGQQLGVLPTAEAMVMARKIGADLVEVAANAKPPVCRIVDFGKFRYEMAKKEKENKKHQHANKVKEVQLSPNIDPHDFHVKLVHAIEFLCEEMKVKISLRFKGREMAHKEIGFEKVSNFLKELEKFGLADSTPRLAGRAINVIVSPLPRTKRAANPHVRHEDAADAVTSDVPAKHGANASPEADGDEDEMAESFAGSPSPKLNGSGQR